MTYFRELEELSVGDSQPLNRIIDNLAFNEQGLIPAIAQDFESGEVLMLAWMNRTALQQTITTGKMTYWSRSREKFWIKGETSGHFQYLVSVKFDCDGDTILCRITQKGSACHTNRKSCFYLKLDTTLERVTIVA
jgi:phosphoribosyl-AMP cyclohydrolase